MTQFNPQSSTTSPTIASASQAAPGAGRLNVITGFFGSYVNSAAAITTGTLIFRNAASGVAPTVFLVPVRTIVAGELFIFNIEFADPFIGSINTATTVEFSSMVAASGAQICQLRGYVI